MLRYLRDPYACSGDSYPGRQNYRKQCWKGNVRNLGTTSDFAEHWHVTKGGCNSSLWDSYDRVDSCWSSEPVSELEGRLENLSDVPSKPVFFVLCRCAWARRCWWCRGYLSPQCSWLCDKIGYNDWCWRYSPVEPSPKVLCPVGLSVLGSAWCDGSDHPLESDGGQRSEWYKQN